MTPVFLDTVGLIALWDRNDQWHSAANHAFSALRETSVPLLTTTFVLLECGNTAARRPYRSAVFRLWERLDVAGMLVRPNDDDLAAAWAAYERQDPGGAGIVDCTSFEVMSRVGITKAFTNDRHFQAVGFEVLF